MDPCNLYIIFYVNLTAYLSHGSMKSVSINILSYLNLTDYLSHGSL